MQGKYYVFKQKFTFVNFSLLSQGPHFYVPTCQALHLLQPSSPTLTSSVVLHSISALNQLLNHFVCLQRCSPIMEMAADKPIMNVCSSSASTSISREKQGGFPGGAVVGNLPANAGDTGSSPVLGRSHMLRSK